MPLQNVWMSHGDEAVELPDGFKCVAKSDQVRASPSEPLVGQAAIGLEG